MEKVIVREATLGQMIKIEVAKKGMTITEIARASGRDQSTVSNMMRKGSVNTSILKELLEGMDEELVFLMKDGSAYKIIE